MKESIPWFVKIPAKIVLSRLPFSYRAWRRMNIFVAGEMDTPEYALGVFQKHFAASGFASLRGRTVLELGPGDSALTGLFARAFGAECTFLVDVEPLASQDGSVFVRAAESLRRHGIQPPEIGNTGSLPDILERLKAVYLTDGLASLEAIPAGSIDLCFSHAVLEHVRLRDFPRLAAQMRRVLKPEGVGSHWIDFQDHLQGSLNNLRFSERVWESDFMAASGFYTNRLPWPAMKKIFETAGLVTELRVRALWPNGLPLAQRRMAQPFLHMPAQELMVRDAHVVLRPAA